MKKKKETRGRKRIRPLDMVKKLYPYHADKEIVELLKVPLSYVRNVGARYKLKKALRPWIQKEEEILLQYYPISVKAAIEALTEAGFIRTKWSLINKWRELNKNETT